MSLKEIIRARWQRKRELQRQVSTRRSLIDQLLAASVPAVAATDAPPPAPPAPAPAPRPALKRYHHD